MPLLGEYGSLGEWDASKFSLQFDSQGSVLLPIFTAEDDIVFETTQKFYAGKVWIGKQSARQDYIIGSVTSATTPFIRINIGGINKDFEFAKMKDGDFVTVRMVRNPGDNVLYISVTYDGVTKGDTLSSGATITFDVIGEYGTPYVGIRYTNNMIGTMQLSRVGDDRLYDFSDNSIADTLIDTVSDQNGTLRNFTVGGFVTAKEILLGLDTYRLRRDINGQADFVINGTITNPLASETIQYSLDGGAYQTLATTTDGAFSTTVTITEIQDLTLRLVSDNTITANATDLKAVFIIYAWGQSNDAGQGENNQVPVITGDNPRPEMIRVLEDGVRSAAGVLSSGTVTIQEVRDPTTAYSVFDTASGSGSTWPFILEQYANRGIPVVLYNISVGGTGIAQWLRNSATDPAYYQEPNELPSVIANMGNPHFITAFRGEYEIARIGEETAPEELVTAQDVENLYNLATDQHFADYNCPTFWTLPTSVAISNYLVYKGAMDNVIASNANAYYGGIIQDVVTLQGPPTDDSIHLTTDTQIRNAAQARYHAFVLEESNLGFFVGSGIPNTAPSLTITSSASTVSAGATFTLTANVTDPDIDDTHTYLWSSGETTQSITITAPSQVTASTITRSCVANDGTADSNTASVTVEVSSNSVNVNLITNQTIDFTTATGDFCFQGVYYHNSWSFRTLKLRIGQDGSFISLRLEERQTRVRLYGPDGTSLNEFVLTGVNNPPNTFLLFGIKLQGNILDFYLGETVELYQLVKTQDLLAWDSRVSALTENTDHSITLTETTSLWSYGHFDVDADIGNLLIEYPVAETTLIANNVKGLFTQVDNANTPEVFGNNNDMSSGYSYVNVGNISGLRHPGAFYTAVINNKEYHVKLGAGNNGFKCDLPPFTSVIGTVISIDNTRSASFRTVTQPISYANSACYCQCPFEDLIITEIDNQPLSDPISEIPYFFPTGEKLGIRANRFNYDPMGVHDSLEGDAIAKHTFVLTFDDGSQAEISVYNFASEDVGVNLNVSNDYPSQIELDTGSVYEFRFNVDDMQLGTVSPLVNGQLIGTAMIESGDRMYQFRATAAETTIDINTSTDFDGIVNSVSIRKVLTNEDPAIIKYIKVHHTSNDLPVNGLDIEWSVTPIGGMFSDVEYTDVDVSGSINIDDTYDLDIKGEPVLSLAAEQYYKSTDNILIPENTACSIKWQCSVPIDLTLQSFSNVTFWGYDVEFPGNTWLRIDQFSGSITLAIVGSVAVKWAGRYIDYSKSNVYELSRDELGNFGLTVNDQPILRELGDDSIYTGEFGVSTLGYRLGQGSSVVDNTIFKLFEVSVDNIVRHSYNFANVNVQDSTFTVTDEIGDNDLTGQNISLRYSDTGFTDTLSTSNTKLSKGRVVNKRLGALFVHNNTGFSARGWQVIDQVNVTNGLPIDEVSNQHGIQLGYNTAYPLKAQIHNCHVNQKLVSNRGSHASLGNSDCYLINSGGGNDGITASVSIFNSVGENGNDGILDTKASITSINNSFSGGNHGYRHHSLGGLNVYANSTHNREKDSTGAIQVISSINSVNLYNFHLDGVEVYSNSQIQSIQNPLAQVGDYGYQRNAISFVTSSQSEFSEQAENNGRKAVRILKSKPRLPDHSNFAYTDFELQHKISGSVDFIPLDLDTDPFQGTKGNMRRSLDLPSGIYDFRIRAVYGPKLGDWLTITEVEINNV